MKPTFFQSRLVFSLLLLPFAWACSSENDEMLPEEPITEQRTISLHSVIPNEDLYPASDSSSDLTRYEANTQLLHVLRKVDSSIGTTLGQVTVSDAQYKEMAAKATEIAGAKTTDKAKYDAIFNWVASNISYDYKGESDQTAYTTFKKKVGNCQGYSNVMRVMLHSLGIRCINVNGMMWTNVYWGGHAWNYVCIGTTWYVCDATNNRRWSAASTSSYSSLLRPQSVDVPLFSDDTFDYGFAESGLAVIAVKNSPDKNLIVPFSVNKLRISRFCPNHSLPKKIENIYLGSNIASIGESGNIALAMYDNNYLTAIHVDPDNKTLCSHKGILYQRNGDEVQLLYVPHGAEYVEFSPKLRTLEKNALQNHKKVEVCYIPEGVQNIEPYAIENCPNLHFIYVPATAKYIKLDSNGNATYTSEVQKTSFTGVASDCQIIVGPVPTGITEIRM